jgi:hypothetical protein
MANSDIYEANSGLISVASTGGTVPVMYVQAPATKRTWIVGVRVGIGVTAAAAGNSILFAMARSTVGTAGGTYEPLAAHDSSAGSALTQAYVSSFGNAPTPTTAGLFLWQQELPQTTGSAWEEFPPLGYEWGIPAGGTVACFAIPSVNTSTPVQFQLIVSE